jgi:hypothetical protein
MERRLYRAEAELTLKLETATEEREKEFTEMRLKLLERDSQMNALAEKVRTQGATLAKVHSILNSIQENRSVGV